MKTIVAVFAVMLAGFGVAFAQQTTTSPFGPTTPTPSLPGSSFTYTPGMPGGMGYNPYSTIPSSSFGYSTGVNPFTSTTVTPSASLFSPLLVTTTPGITSTAGLSGQGSQVLGTGGTSSMFNGMFGLNPAALNPFSLFGSPTTLNPFSMFFGNTATAPSPVVQTPSTVTTPSMGLTPTPTPGG